MRGGVITNTKELPESTGLLARIPLFSGCTQSELQDLAAAAHPLAFHEGDVLCAAGDDSPECYVVSEGEAAVTVGNVRVSTVGPVDVVGERGPITGRHRAATVTATTRMVTYAIPREHIQALLDRSPVAAGAMRDELLRRYG